MKSRGLNTLIECGPGKVLAGLVKRIDPSLSAYTVSDPVTLADVKAALA